MSQPQEKRARVQQEQGSPPSSPHHTPYEDIADRGVVEEKGMEVAPPLPVKAVVLSRPDDEAPSGTVLLSRDSFPRFGDQYTADQISTVSALAVVARARAEKDLRQWEVDGPVRVYDYNPTDVPSEELTNGRSFNLQLRKDRRELANDIPLHEHKDPDNEQKIVDTFFVLLTACKEQPEVSMHIPPAFGQSGQLVINVQAAATELVNALISNSSRNLLPRQFLTLDPCIAGTAVNLDFAYDSILYREAYEQLINLIMQEQKKLPSNKYFVEVSGTPGIGKSTMIIFLLRHLFLDRKKVVHILSDSIAVMYTPTVDGYQVQVAAATMLNGAVADAFVTDLKKPPHTAFRGLYFWTHSPGVKTTGLLSTADVLMLPVWSYDELTSLNHHLQQEYKEDDGTPKFPALSDEDLNANFARWGGIPRLVMQSTIRSEDLLQDCFNRIKATHPDDIGVMSRAMTTSVQSETLQDRLFLIAVDKRFKLGARYWSKKTGEFMLNEFRNHIDQLQRQFATMFGGTPQAHATYGKLFEPFCHGLFSSGKELAFELRHLPRPEIKEDDVILAEAETAEAVQNLGFAAESLTVVWFNSLQRLKATGVRECIYYRPTFETLRSGDAFLLIGNVLHIFQVTVGERHPVIGQGILDIIELFSEVPELETRLVFLVPPGVSDEFRHQSYLVAGEKKVLRWSQQQHKLRRVKQYVAGIDFGLELPKNPFEDIAEADCTFGETNEEVKAEV